MYHTSVPFVLLPPFKVGLVGSDEVSSIKSTRFNSKLLQPEKLQYKQALNPFVRDGLSGSLTCAGYSVLSTLKLLSLYTAQNILHILAYSTPGIPSFRPAALALFTCD